MIPMPLFSENPVLIIEKVARQLGVCPHEAAAQMGAWDGLAMQLYHVGNSMPRGELH